MKVYAFDEKAICPVRNLNRYLKKYALNLEHPLFDLSPPSQIIYVGAFCIVEPLTILRPMAFDVVVLVAIPRWAWLMAEINCLFTLCEAKCKLIQILGKNQRQFLVFAKQ